MKTVWRESTRLQAGSEIKVTWELSLLVLYSAPKVISKHTPLFFF